MNETSIKNDAAVLADGIELGITTVADAIAWADRLIAELDAPPYAVIEVALATRADDLEVQKLLRAFSGNIDRQFINRRLFAQIQALLVAGAISGCAAARIVYLMTICFDVEPEVAEQIRPFEYLDILLEEGNTTADEIHGTLLSFLKEHSH